MAATIPTIRSRDQQDQADVLDGPLATLARSRRTTRRTRAFRCCVTMSPFVRLSRPGIVRRRGTLNKTREERNRVEWDRRRRRSPLGLSCVVVAKSRFSMFGQSYDEGPVIATGDGTEESRTGVELGDGRRHGSELSRSRTSPRRPTMPAPKISRRRSFPPARGSPPPARRIEQRAEEHTEDVDDDSRTA